MSPITSFPCRTEVRIFARTSSVYADSAMEQRAIVSKIKILFSMVWGDQRFLK
jgi:hypothetical protein